MKTTQHHKGFTLVEVIIVVLIISILATLALLNFNKIRKSAQLDFAADSITNLVNSTRDNSRLGKEQIDNHNACWGIILDTQANTPKDRIQQFTTKYIRSEDNCDLSSTNKLSFKRANPLENEPIQISKLTTNTQTEAKKIIIINKPPKGEVEIYDNIESSPKPLQNIKSVEIHINFENTSTDTSTEKQLQINSFTGEIKRLKATSTQ